MIYKRPVRKKQNTKLYALNGSMLPKVHSLYKTYSLISQEEVISPMFPLHFVTLCFAGHIVGSQIFVK